MMQKIIGAILLCLTFLQSFSQEKSPIKYGKVTAEDFTRKPDPADSSANAIVIGDIGSTGIVGNSKGWFSLEYKRYRRVRIVNKNGYDAADVQIGIYTDGDAEEQLNNLKAVTYNLENGKVVETKLETKSAVFKDKINKNLVIKKFTFPNIKEGSIIEYQYTIQSDFIFNLQPWEFQGAYPCKWSEYKVSIPEFLGYITLWQGYLTPIKTAKDKTEYFTISSPGGTNADERTSFTAGTTEHTWLMKDVPALKEESYTSTLNNHISRIEFQLSEYKSPLTPRRIMPSWFQVCDELLKDEDFGYSLNRDNGWLNDAMDVALKNATTDLDKARNIYAYVRDNMTCTNHNRKYLEKPLKMVLKSRNGNEAEINLLLTAMLLKAHLPADPIMLSTRSHGYVYSMYPLMDRFNYVICRVRINDEFYYLDASLPGMGFNRLSTDLYNGHARVIDKNATFTQFLSDSLIEKKLSSVIIINDEKENLTGTMRQTPGYYSSYELRSSIREKGKEQVFADIKKDFNVEVELSNPTIDSLDKFELPLNISYDFTIKNDKEDILYVNPMFGEGWGENPFKSAERTYPIEMPCTIDETYLLRMDIPQGYVVDELPKPIKVKLNEDDDGLFEYIIQESDGAISLRSRVILRRAAYKPEEYEMLREFFNLVVKKHNEQIVFKKKK